jgi:LacI family transcriptional regulator
VIEGHNTPESGSDAIKGLLTAADLPTAILCSNDLTAIGAIQALNRSGLRVPEDISVVGADDIPLAQLMTPTLTTVHLPRQDLGRMAFSIIEKMLNGEFAGGAEFFLDTHLIVRGSTGSGRRSDISS